MGFFGRKKKEPPPDEIADAPRYPRPTQEAVAWRALCLGALSLRSQVEWLAQEGVRVGMPLEPHRIPAEQTVKWVRDEGIEAHLSPEERKVFFLPLGRWAPKQVIDAHWRNEAFGCLCWALSLVERMPPWDTSFHGAHPRLGPDAGILGSVREFLMKVRLRPPELLLKMRAAAEGWHWRSRTYRLMRENHPLPPNISWDEILKVSSHGHHADGDIPPPIRDDFPVLNKAYREVTPDEHAELTSTAMERHFALNWLSGYSRDWDSTRTDT